MLGASSARDLPVSRLRRRLATVGSRATKSTAGRFKVRVCTRRSACEAFRLADAVGGSTNGAYHFFATTALRAGMSSVCSATMCFRRQCSSSTCFRRCNSLNGVCGDQRIPERGVRGLSRTVPRSGFGESHCEGRPRLGRRTHLNVPAVCRDDRSRDEQAKADAVRPRLGIGASERFEYRWQCLLRNR